MTKTFQIKIKEGDAVIKLNANKDVELIFGEDDDTVFREKEWHEQEVYKTSVQFALMIDTYFRNDEGLDDIIMHSESGNLAAELIGKEYLSISLASADNNEEEISESFNKMKEEMSKGPPESSDKDNVVDATTRFKKDE